MTEEQTEKPTEQDLIDEEWTTANYEDLKCLKVPDEPRLVKIPIDSETKKYIAFWIKDLNVDDHLNLMEAIFTLDPKTEKAKMNLNAYYQSCYNRMVHKVDPPLKWAQLKYFKADFFTMVKALFPEPLAKNKIGGITDKDEGN